MNLQAIKILNDCLLSMPLICLHFSFIRCVEFMFHWIMARLIGIISDIIVKIRA